MNKMYCCVTIIIFNDLEIISSVVPIRIKLNPTSNIPSCCSEHFVLEGGGGSRVIQLYRVYKFAKIGVWGHALPPP